MSRKEYFAYGSNLNFEQMAYRCPEATAVGIAKLEGYGAAMTVTFMNAWNSYLWPKIVFQQNSAITMPMLVANLKSGYTVDYGMLMLGVLICTLPTAIIFLCLQKSFANGITGAIK